MWNSGRVFNPIAKVEFAGFMSDTVTLQRAGWQLSIERMAHMDGIRLALKFEPARLYALSAPISMHDIQRYDLFKQPQFEWPIPFRIQIIGNDVRFQIMPVVGSFGKFSPFDAMPSYENVTTHPCPNYYNSELINDTSPPAYLRLWRTTPPGCRHRRGLCADQRTRD